MNIILINHYAGSVRHGMEYRTYYLAKEWVKLGHQVTVIGASYSHGRSVQPEIAGRYRRESIDGIRYIWVRTPAYHGNGIGRAINIFTFVGTLLWCGKKILPERTAHVVIASSTYPLDILPARRMALQTGSELFFEVHDLWPLSPIELGGMPVWHPFIVLLQWAENYAYRHAAKVVSILPKAEQHMREHGLAAGKFFHIPNGIELTEWTDEVDGLPEDHRRLLARLKEEGQFIVGYAGYHGLANSLSYLVEAGSLLRDAPVSIVLVGHGTEKDLLQRMARERTLTNVEFLPDVPKSVIPSLLSQMDTLFIGLKHQSVFRFGVSPNKLLDYMMAGRPVIYAIDAGNDLVKESGCGLSIPPEDPHAIAEAVRQLCNMTPLQREELGLRGKEYAKTHHDYRILARRFLQLMGEKDGDRLPSAVAAEPSRIVGE